MSEVMGLGLYRRPALHRSFFFSDRFRHGTYVVHGTDCSWKSSPSQNRSPVHGTSYLQLESNCPQHGTAVPNGLSVILVCSKPSCWWVKNALRALET